MIRTAKPRRILVTGAGGFIGKHLVRTFVQLGHTVRAATTRPEAVRWPGVETVHAVDLAEPQSWAKALTNVEIIVHLAAIAHITERIDPDTYDRVNHRGTANLAAAATAQGIERFVFMSSINAQAPASSDRVLTEADPPAPVTAYGRSKLAAEHALRNSGVRFTILRPVLVYGPGVKGNFATLLKLADSPVPLPFGSLQNRRSFLSVANLIEATRFVMDAPASLRETYVVADDSALPLREVFAILRRELGRRPVLVPVPPRLIEAGLMLVGRHGLWERLGGSLVVDAKKLRAAGWRPVTDTPEAMAQLARAYRGSG